MHAHIKAAIDKALASEYIRHEFDPETYSHRVIVGDSDNVSELIGEFVPFDELAQVVADPDLTYLATTERIAKNKVFPAENKVYLVANLPGVRDRVRRGSRHVRVG